MQFSESTFGSLNILMAYVRDFNQIPNQIFFFFFFSPKMLNPAQKEWPHLKFLFLYVWRNIEANLMFRLAI